MCHCFTLWVLYIDVSLLHVTEVLCSDVSAAVEASGSPAFRCGYCPDNLIGDGIDCEREYHFVYETPDSHWKQRYVGRTKAFTQDA